jgi:glucan-binding YG repeat protein
MATGALGLPDGIYYLDPADGHQVVGWVQQPDGWHYYDANNGRMLANVTALLDNVNCSFDKNGVLVEPAGWTPASP